MRTHDMDRGDHAPRRRRCRAREVVPAAAIALDPKKLETDRQAFLKYLKYGEVGITEDRGRPQAVPMKREITFSPDGKTWTERIVPDPATKARWW